MAVPMLPVSFLAFGAVLFLFISLRAMQGQVLAFKFFYLAVGVRLMVNFYHVLTVPPLVAGQSPNSLLALAIIAAGLYLSRSYLLRFKAFIPLYLFMFMLVFSGVFNGEYSGIVNALLRQLLFLVAMIMMIKSLDAEPNDGSFARRVLTIFIVPLLFQAASVAIGMTTLLEADGASGYVGGYIHEGVFSSLLLTGLAFVVLASGLTWRERTLYAAIFFVAIFLANYRTALLAALPLLFGHLIIGSGQGFRADVAVVIRTVTSLLAVLVGLLIFALMAQRLSDVSAVATDLSNIFKPPSAFSAADRSLFSGRLLIWSDYVFRTISSNFSHIMIGFGPDAWEGEFAKYAHNVYISYIYEVGILGLAVYVFMTLSFLWMAISTKHSRRWAVVSAHLGYFVFSIGTMPTVTIEGVLLYAVICGYTVHYRLLASQQTHFLFPDNARHFEARSLRAQMRSS